MKNHALGIAAISLSLLVSLSLTRAGWAGEKAAPHGKSVEARTSATAWLALVDAGKYGESWDGAASLFRAAITRDKWTTAASGARGPLGKLVSRKLKSAEHKTKLPGAPDGEYVVLQFDTTFEKKATAVETVTPMLDTDGVWRVSGYFVR
jgi:Protein of unknown function (DUF4019)